MTRDVIDVVEELTADSDKMFFWELSKYERVVVLEEWRLFLVELTVSNVVLHLLFVLIRDLLLAEAIQKTLPIYTVLARIIHRR